MPACPYPFPCGFIAYLSTLLSLEEYYVKLVSLPSASSNLKVDCAPGLNADSDP